MIKEIWDTLSLGMIEEVYIAKLKEEYAREFSSKDKKFLEDVIFQHNKMSKENVAKAIILYIIFDEKRAIEYSRKKGAFRYKSFGVEKNNAYFYLDEIMKRKMSLELSDDNKNYLTKKVQCKWMLSYYEETEEKLRRKIKQHHDKRLYYEKKGATLETTLFLELLACLEIVFRYDEGRNKAGAKSINRNAYENYSKEEIGEAISYLIFLYTDEIGIEDNKNYWLDTDFVFSEELEEMVLESCKYNMLIEWEMLIDYYGFDINEENHQWIISGSRNSLEKSIRLGYVKQIMQEAVFNIKQVHNQDECSLEQMASILVDEFGKQVVEFEHAGFMSRYRFKIDERIIKAFVAPKDLKEVALFVEEIDTINYMSREFLITFKDMCFKKITEHCTMIDLLRFKRFFLFMAFVQKHIFKNEENFNHVAASVTPVFWEHQLFSLIDMFTGDRIKTIELLNLLTWNGKDKLDMQYTPIFKVGKRYYFSMATFAMSNSCRNVVANSYYLKNQIVNSDGCIDPLVKMCEEAFKECEHEYILNTNLKFIFQGQEGEIDFVASTGDDVFIFECKAPFMPTNNFEMRTTYDYINKANKQLTHCVNAFNDITFRKKYFKQWGLSFKIKNIYTCILMGNRLFSGYDGFEHPIRYIRELDMILNRGEIRSQVGTWSYWQDEKYCEQELIKFLSKNDPLTRSFFESMVEYEEHMTCGEEMITYTSYYYDTYKNMEKNDQYYKIINKNDSLREKLRYQYKNKQ